MFTAIAFQQRMHTDQSFDIKQRGTYPLYNKKIFCQRVVLIFDYPLGGYPNVSLKLHLENSSTIVKTSSYLQEKDILYLCP